jgi:hypothetical protein
VPVGPTTGGVIWTGGGHGNNEDDRLLTMSNVVKIDLDKIWNPIGVGIRGAYVFAGFGINASNDPRLVDYHLPGLMKLSFAPQSVDQDLLGEYKREFANWILGNAQGSH